MSNFYQALFNVNKLELPNIGKISGVKMYELAKNMFEAIKDPDFGEDFSYPCDAKRGVQRLRWRFDPSVTIKGESLKDYYNKIFIIESESIDVNITRFGAKFEKGDHRELSNLASMILAKDELIAQKIREVNELDFMPRMFRLKSIKTDKWNIEPLAAWMFRGTTYGFCYLSDKRAAFFETGSNNYAKYSTIDIENILKDKKFPERYRKKILFNIDLFT